MEERGVTCERPIWTHFGGLCSAIERVPGVPSRGLIVRSPRLNGGKPQTLARKCTDIADGHRLPAARRCDCGEGEGEAAQVFLGAVQRLPILLDRRQKFSHRAPKAVVEPCAVKARAGATLRSGQRNSLLAKVRPVADQAAPRVRRYRSCRAGRMASPPSNTSEACPPSTCTSACASKRHLRRLAPRAWLVVATTLCTRSPATLVRKSNQWIAEIVEDQILDLLERRACDPAVVPVDRDMATDAPRRSARRAPPLASRPDAVPSGRSG